MSKQEDVVATNVNHDFLIDPSFQGANRLFVLPFAIPPGDNPADVRVGKGYYSPNRDVTNYNVMINGKTF